jgi:hypothetical protein
MKIRGLTISHARYKVKPTRIHEKEIYDRLEILEEELAKSPNKNNRQEFVTITKELENINNERTNGAQIRARAMHIELNEK